MSKRLTSIPYLQFFTGPLVSLLPDPSPAPMPSGLNIDVQRLLDAEIKFGVKAYSDGKATRVFTYRGDDHNDPIEVVDIFKGSSNADIEYAHRRLMEKTIKKVLPADETCQLRFAHDGKSA